MKTLVLLRHAKAERPEEYADDADRPLSSRGRLDAAAAGRWLLVAGLRPNLVLCSPAVRTRQTWQAAASEFGSVPVVYEQRLYAGDAADALDLVRTTDHAIATLLLVGHNPTLSIASVQLDDGAGQLRTTGVAVHRVDGGWDAFDRGAAPLVDQHTARG